MASIVEICNQALAKVGGGRINNLNDGTQEAILCNLLFDTLVEETIAEGQWSSAVYRQTLNKTLNTPNFGFTSEFQLPTNPKVINVLEINEIRAGDIEYSIEGNKLLTDETQAKIKYIGLISDSQKFGPYLTRVLVTRLASELAFPLTSNRALAESLSNKYEFDLDNAMNKDNQQGTSIETVSDDLIDVRINASDFIKIKAT